jgi:hypothetical protein
MQNWATTKQQTNSFSSLDDSELPLPRWLDEDQNSPTFAKWLFYDPIKAIHNEGQRTHIYRFVHFWIEYTKRESDDTLSSLELLRGIVAGEAGTGKTYCMKIMTTIVCLLFRHVKSVLTMAPTGVAASACGGEVSDSALKYNRTSNENKDLNAQTLLMCQEAYKNVHLLLRDEMSMEGKKMQGHILLRAQQIFNKGDRQDDSVGGVPCSFNLGDHQQLPPVKDSAIFLPSSNRDSQPVAQTRCQIVPTSQRKRFLFR